MSIKKRAEWLKKKIFAENKYGDINDFQKKKLLEKNAIKLQNNKTSPEIKFENMLKRNHIAYECQKIVADVIYDYYLISTNTIVEIDGDYYHSNPDIYKESELNGMQRKNKIKDGYKNAIAKTFKFNLIRIWEKDINENFDKVEKMIKDYEKK